MAKFIAIAVFGGVFQWAYLAAVHQLGGPLALVLVCLAISVLSALLLWQRLDRTRWLLVCSGPWPTAGAVLLLQVPWSIAATVLVAFLQLVVFEAEPKARPP